MGELDLPLRVMSIKIILEFRNFSQIDVPVEEGYTYKVFFDPHKLFVLVLGNYTFAEISTENPAKLHQLALINLVLFEFALYVQQMDDRFYVNTEYLLNHHLRFRGKHFF